ncbi:SOS response-associated peptidase [Thermomonospora umbrina]|uniref:Abasic site processing protein n=1 Tax=Thermomonospora umbrina TaxID=111806 RepID=A0A3D9SWA7_9ACTN|nr:SOS response-associated peptidase [Thermomonospora umbrina]REE98800.1 putative SOS response-associated peptidase YedK [Thermomonospora umbrina]
MCGRYATARARQELIDEFQVQLDATEDAVRPDYNVAPTKLVPAVLTRAPRPADGSEALAEQAEQQAVRQLRALRWGLVPSWAKDPKIGNRMINARAETVHEKPSYRRAFAKRRCLLPADGFFEWYNLEREGHKPAKQPFFIRPRDGAVMAMAGLYELWRSPEDEWLWTCTVITTQATDDVGRIHDRMPMTVAPDHWDAWLDPELTALEDVRGLLVPAMNGTMEAFPVSKAVNNVRNNGPELIQPAADGHISGDEPGSSALF